MIGDWMVAKTASVILTGYILQSQIATKTGGSRNNNQECCGGNSRIYGNVKNIFEFDGFMDKELHNKGIYTCHNSGLIGCKGPGKDTAKNNHNQHEGPETLFKGRQDLFESGNRHSHKIGLFPVDKIGV